MSQALELVRSGEFLKAASIYDELAGQLRNKPAEVIFLFNSGSSYREAGDCKRSVLRYQRLLDRSFKSDLFKARGLFEISRSYECLGSIKAAYLALADVSSFRSHLPGDIRIAVYPARMSLAHAWFQQFKKADGYQSLALNGILQLKMNYSEEEKMKKALSKVFYNMGQSKMQKENIKPEAFLSAFPYHQLYLLQSVFLRDDLWSAQSRDALQDVFENLSIALKKKSIRKKYKEYILLSLKEGKLLVEKEKNKELKSFYFKLSEKIPPLF